MIPSAVVIDCHNSCIFSENVTQKCIHKLNIRPSETAHEERHSVTLEDKMEVQWS